MTFAAQIRERRVWNPIRQCLSEGDWHSGVSVTMDDEGWAFDFLQLISQFDASLGLHV